MGDPGGKLAEGGKPLGLLEALAHLLDASEVTFLILKDEPQGEETRENDEAHGQKEEVAISLQDLIHAISLETHPHDAGGPSLQGKRRHDHEVLLFAQPHVSGRNGGSPGQELLLRGRQVLQCRLLAPGPENGPPAVKDGDEDDTRRLGRFVNGLLHCDPQAPPLQGIVVQGNDDGPVAAAPAQGDNAAPARPLGPAEQVDHQVLFFPDGRFGAGEDRPRQGPALIQHAAPVVDDGKQPEALFFDDPLGILRVDIR